MNKKIKIFIIISIFISTVFINPAIGYESDEILLTSQSLNLKALIAIGLINLNTQQKEINGFVIIGYNAGETITFQTINIQYQGIPFVVTKSLFFIFCIYNEADVNFIQD